MLPFSFSSFPPFSSVELPLAMGLITPGQLKQQGEFYHQLASMTRAGVSIVQAIELLRKNPPNRKLRFVADKVGEAVERGATFTEALRSAGRKMPEFDVSLIEAGETSGRLAEALKMLGDFYDERARLLTKVISAMMYPMFMLHMAILIFPTSLLTGMILGQGQGGAYLFNKVNTLVPLYGITYFIIWSVQSDRGRRWRDFVERLLNAIPVASRTQRDLALARLCAALEALINAGVTIIEAWDIAARASGSQQIERAVAAVRPRIVAGELPSDAISTQRVYPDLFITSYRTGEVSGQLDDALRRLYRLYMDQATTNLQRLAEWLPKIVYLIVALWIAYQIVAFYDNYFNKQLAPLLQ